MKGPSSVEEYILLAPKEHRSKLRRLRAAIMEVAPEAKESISYGMPYFSFNGRLAWFGIHKSFIGLYVRPPVLEMHSHELANYQKTKSALHLPLDKELPLALVARLLRTRMALDAKGD